MYENTLTRAEIVERIYEKSVCDRGKIKVQVEALLDIIKDVIKNDRSLVINGFGKFEAYDKHAHKGRNPQTGESITIPERKVAVFRTSGNLRAELNPK